MIAALRGPHRGAVPKMPLSWFALQTTAGQRWSGLSPNLCSSTLMRWALRVAALDQHHVCSHRADHGPKHEPGEDLIPKDHKLTALRNPAPCLVAKRTDAENCRQRRPHYRRPEPKQQSANRATQGSWEQGVPHLAWVLYCRCERCTKFEHCVSQIAYYGTPITCGNSNINPPESFRRNSLFAALA